MSAAASGRQTGGREGVIPSDPVLLWGVRAGRGGRGGEGGVRGEGEGVGVCEGKWGYGMD